MLKVNNSNTRRTCKICSNLTLKTPKRRHWRCSGVFFVSFEYIFTPPNVFIADFEQVIFAETVKYFTSFNKKQKFHYVFLKNVTHFSTHSKPQSLSCRNQSIWFVVNWFAWWFEMSKEHPVFEINENASIRILIHGLRIKGAFRTLSNI